MPYYTDSPIGADAGLQDLAPSLGMSVGAAVDDAFTSNPTTVIYDYTKFSRANAGAKLDKTEAEGRVKEAGVQLKIPDSGYSEDALGLLIDRKRDEITRQSVLARAPAGVVPSTTRFAASLLTGVLDPLNVASAFVPVVGQARYAEMLAGASGALGRAGVRAAVGGAEGLVGAALVEPINYFGRTQMQDDYHMTDSLLNLAMGAGLGGVLHAGGGAAGDALGVSQFMRTQQLKTIEAADTARREAAALLTPEPARPVERPWYAAPEIATAPEAPFAKRWEASPESARAAALAEMTPELRAQLLADAGGRAEPGVIPQARTQIEALDQRLQALDGDEEFRRRAKEFQALGNSRKEAEAETRKALAREKADVEATRQRLQETVDANARAAQAEQDVARLDAGEVPERFAGQVEERTQQLLQASALERAMHADQVPARFVIGMADPAQRDAAMRIAVAQTMQGRMPDVQTLFARSADPVADARVVSERQGAPESIAVADFNASRAADERIAAEPKTDPAQALLDVQTEKLDALLKNLEQRGMDPKRVEAMRAELAPFDEALADSKKLGEAMKAAAVCGIK